MPRVRELHVTYRAHTSGATFDARKIDSPKAAAALATSLLGDEAQEVMLAFLIDAKGRLLAVHEVSRGGMHCTIVDPKILFRALLLGNAASFILAHNHPSGDPTPSQEDLTTTRSMKAVASMMELPIMDHIIVGDGKYCSFKETGRMDYL